MSEPKFERGTNLSIFVSDRREDLGSLVFALLIAIGIVLLLYGHQLSLFGVFRRASAPRTTTT